MPRLHDFGAYAIWMYFEDHNPPHVHVVSAAFQALVGIVNFEILAGEIPPAHRREALAWIRENSVMLLRRWEEYH